MKTRIIQPTEQKPEQPIKYPCLMTGPLGRLIAIATDPASGVVLDGNCTRVYDKDSITWKRDGWAPMRGKVVIEFDMEDNP